MSHRADIPALHLRMLEAICKSERYLSAQLCDIKMHNLMHSAEAILALGEYLDSQRKQLHESVHITGGANSQITVSRPTESLRHCSPSLCIPTYALSNLGADFWYLMSSHPSIPYPNSQVSSCNFNMITSMATDLCDKINFDGLTFAAPTSAPTCADFPAQNFMYRTALRFLAS